ncbi:MAG: DinB family protein [Gemmatimonadetes bacterium]|nr:DinB family protein [Gemmatimonadota bacterium]
MQNSDRDGLNQVAPTVGGAGGTSATPPWRVDAWSLSEDLAKIAQQWRSVREILDDPRLYDLREPTVSGWSCGEHAGHIVTGLHQVTIKIEASLAEPDRNSGEALSERAPAILRGGGFPRGAGRASGIADTSGRPRRDFLPVLASAIQAWSGVAARATELPDCPARFRHGAMGYMRCTEWVRFAAIHSAHHLAIVRDVRGLRP